MEKSAGFVDIHCHCLPGLDDGADDEATSLAMVRMAAADGTGILIATPHQLGGFHDNHAAQIRELGSRLRGQLDDEGIEIELLVGADVRVEPDLVAHLRSDHVLTLADHRRHVLLELPHELYFPLEPLLKRLADQGITGILTHPERNLGLLSQPQMIPQLMRAGCLMQVTAGSFVGSFGPHSQRFAEAMLKQGQVHFVASDGHGLRRRRPILSAAFSRVKELSGESVANLLFRELPGRVARGESVATDPITTRRRTSWLSFSRSA